MSSSVNSDNINFTALEQSTFNTIETIFSCFFSSTKGYRYRKDVRETNTGGDESRAAVQTPLALLVPFNLPSSK